MIRKHLEPFQTFWQLFNFRATAAYYLCHYAVNKDPLLGHFGPKPGSDLKELKYYHQLLSEDAKFQSAIVSFCPDPCCGEAFFKHARGAVGNLSANGWQDRCLGHFSNPCATFGNGTCRLSLAENTDLDSLKGNKLNHTCLCDSGYRYASELTLCVDVDECETGAHSCTDQGQTCFNTPGSFVCHCEFGYRKDGAWSCVQDPFKVPVDT